MSDIGEQIENYIDGKFEAINSIELKSKKHINVLKNTNKKLEKLTPFISVVEKLNEINQKNNLEKIDKIKQLKNSVQLRPKKTYQRQSTNNSVKNDITGKSVQMDKDTNEDMCISIKNQISKRFEKIEINMSNNDNSEGYEWRKSLVEKPLPICENKLKLRSQKSQFDNRKTNEKIPLNTPNHTLSDCNNHQSLDIERSEVAKPDTEDQFLRANNEFFEERNKANDFKDISQRNIEKQVEEVIFQNDIQDDNQKWEQDIIGVEEQKIEVEDKKLKVENSANLEEQQLDSKKDGNNHLSIKPKVIAQISKREKEIKSDENLKNLNKSTRLIKKPNSIKNYRRESAISMRKLVIQNNIMSKDNNFPNQLKNTKNEGKKTDMMMPITEKKIEKDLKDEKAHNKESLRNNRKPITQRNIKKPEIVQSAKNQKKVEGKKIAKHENPNEKKAPVPKVNMKKEIPKINPNKEIKSEVRTLIKKEAESKKQTIKPKIPKTKEKIKTTLAKEKPDSKTQKARKKNVIKDSKEETLKEEILNLINENSKDPILIVEESKKDLILIENLNESLKNDLNNNLEDSLNNNEGDHESDNILQNTSQKRSKENSKASSISNTSILSDAKIKEKRRKSNFFKNLLFNCQFDKIDHKYESVLNISEKIDDLTQTTNLSNLDKMFFYEIMEEDDSLECLNNSSVKINITNNTKDMTYENFLTLQSDRNKYFLNKPFCKVLCKEIIKKTQKEIQKIDYNKHSYVRDFGIILIHTQVEFKLSFFSNFYLNHIENEYLKSRDDFKTNSFLESYIEIFSLIDNVKYQSDTDGVPAVIRKLKNFTPSKISIENKIKIEGILKNNLMLFDTNQAFKCNQLTGYFCHILRDIVFFIGIICNREYSLPENFNTISFYKFLIEKKKFYNLLIDRINKIIS